MASCSLEISAGLSLPGELRGPERFSDAKLRLSGVSLGRQLGTILGGGLMPIIAASLQAWSGGALTWVLAYFVLICGMAIGAVISARETAKTEMERLAS